MAIGIVGEVDKEDLSVFEIAFEADAFFYSVSISGQYQDIVLSKDCRYMLFEELDDVVGFLTEEFSVDFSQEEIEESIDWMLSGKQWRPKTDVGYRQVGTGAQILKDLNVHKMRVLSAPFKFSGISGFGLEVTEYIRND